MALEELHSTVNRFTFNLFGTETEKKIGSFLFDEGKEWATSKELHGMAALTFNEEQCNVVMTLMEKALDPKDSSWRTLHKAVRLLKHFVLFGAERCVDHAWRQQRRVEELSRYNSAIHGRTATFNGGGTDWGGPVRREAGELIELLGDPDKIRSAREQGRDPDALLPMGNDKDYSPPPKETGILLGKDNAFGVVQTGAIGAKFTMEQVPGMYQGRPDRYFDNQADPRRRTSETVVEDSDYTRQALAPDLLDLDIGETQQPSLPETQDLVTFSKEADLQRQLQEQQQQLEQLKLLMAQQGAQDAGQGGQAQAHHASGSGSGVLGGRGAVQGLAQGPNKVDGIMQAFGGIGSVPGSGGFVPGHDQPGMGMHQQWQGQGQGQGQGMVLGGGGYGMGARMNLGTGGEHVPIGVGGGWQQAGGGGGQNLHGPSAPEVHRNMHQAQQMGQFGGQREGGLGGLSGMGGGYGGNSGGLL